MNWFGLVGGRNHSHPCSGLTIRMYAREIGNSTALLLDNKCHGRPGLLLGLPSAWIWNLYNSGLYTSIMEQRIDGKARRAHALTPGTLARARASPRQHARAPPSDASRASVPASCVAMKCREEQPDPGAVELGNSP
jgi:hypothetical protein